MVYDRGQSPSASTPQADEKANKKASTKPNQYARQPTQPDPASDPKSDPVDQGLVLKPVILAWPTLLKAIPGTLFIWIFVSFFAAMLLEPLLLTYDIATSPFLVVVPFFIFGGILHLMFVVLREFEKCQHTKFHFLGNRLEFTIDNPTKKKTIKIDRITDVIFNQTSVQKMCGVGTLVLRLDTGHDLWIRNIEYPAQMLLEVKRAARLLH